MKRISSYLFTLLAFAGLSLFTSCGDDTEVDPTETLPQPDGTVLIEFRNYPGNDPSVNAAAGDLIVVSVKMTKAANGTRPQKLRIYETDVLNTRGTQVKVEGQGNNEGTIDLRNVDEQTKTIDYTIPATASGTKYLYFEVDESGDKFSRKVLRINISGSGSIDSFTNITLGAQNNAAPSRMSSATGYVYLACEVEENINYIDITYASTAAATNYLSSNPARFQAPIGLTVTTRDCGDEGTINTNGGNATYFVAAPAGTNFATADNATLEALTVTTSNPQYIAVQNGSIYAFRNSEGKKGLIKVNSLAGGPSGTINIDVKVQR
jgi:hypothetical protein